MSNIQQVLLLPHSVRLSTSVPGTVHRRADFYLNFSGLLHCPLLPVHNWHSNHDGGDDLLIDKHLEEGYIFGADDSSS